MDDAASLANLQPIVVPEPVGLLPLAPGWLVLLVAIALALLILAWRRWLAWRDDLYRRQALRELSDMDDIRALPGLLRRAALSAWPREMVAALEASEWHRFLDESAGLDRFRGPCGPLLDRAAYGGTPLSREEDEALRTAARDWLRGHRRPD